MRSEQLIAERESEALLGVHGGDMSAATRISLLDVLIILARRKRFIARTVLAFTVLGVLIAFLWPVSYTAITTILPPQQSSSSSSALLSQLGNLSSLASLGGGSTGGGGLGIKNPIDLYVALLKSQTVEDAMIYRYELMHEYRDKRLSQARKDLERHSTVDGTGKDGLIRISYKDHDAARAAELANGYVAQYRKLTANLAIGEASQRRMFLEQQLEQAKNKLADAEETLKRTEQSTGLIEINSQARALIESAGSLRAQVAAKEVQVQSMRSYAAEGNVDLIQAEQELAGLRAQLSKLGGSADSSTGDLVVPKGRISEAGLEYVRKLRDVKYNETLFEILARQFEMAKLDEAREGALIQVVDPAKTPDRHSSPHRLLVILGAFLLGCIVAAAWATLSEALLHLEGRPEYSDRLRTLRAALGLKPRRLEHSSQA